jgi:hypothetical protein
MKWKKERRKDEQKWRVYQGVFLFAETYDVSEGQEWKGRWAIIYDLFHDVSSSL